MNEIVIAPSILSMDFSQMQQQIEALNKSKAAWIHFDVMDGHFVPNLTFGPTILAGFRKLSTKYIDVHLMVSDPMKYIPPFASAGADMITFHTEALDNDLDKIKEAIDLIHTFGKDAGFVVKPGTKIEQFESLLRYVDMVLIMSVEPGFGGQPFKYDQLEKATWLKAKRTELDLSYRIEIDGGINAGSYKYALFAGCDTLVAGSFVFKGNIEENVKELLK